MQREHIVSILESLANGVDPTTDTELPQPLFHSPDVIRALFTAAQMLSTQPTHAVRRPNAPPSAGARWTDAEDAQVCEEYDGGMSFSDIAQKHQRTTGAIMSRLAKLGRVDPDSLGIRLRDRSANATQ